MSVSDEVPSSVLKFAGPKRNLNVGVIVLTLKIYYFS
jgi:hypothetical protein